jgi:hypothetical protein
MLMVDNARTARSRLACACACARHDFERASGENSISAVSQYKKNNMFRVAQTP